MHPTYRPCVALARVDGQSVRQKEPSIHPGCAATTWTGPSTLTLALALALTLTLPLTTLTSTLALTVFRSPVSGLKNPLY